MRNFVLLMLLSLYSLADSNYISMEYTSLKHRDKPLNNFLSLYGKVEDKYEFLDGDLDVRGGVTTHGVIQKSGDFELFDTVYDTKGLIHSLAVDYYPTADILLSLGRESMKLNLLNGSFDGVMAVGNLDDLSLKTFYFNYYSILYPSYFKSEEIEDGLYGLNFSYSRGVFDVEGSFFVYGDHSVSDLYMALLYNSFILGAEELSFQSSTLANEGAIKLLAGYRYDRFYLEGGYYSVYDGALQNIYNLGGTEFKSFGLNSFLNHEEADNIYTDLLFNHHLLYTKLHLGRSSFVEEGVDVVGDELGLTVGVRYKQLEASATYLTQKSDQSGVAGSRTDWVQTHLKYRF